MDCLKQQLGEDFFSRQEELVFAQCDRRRRARPAALLSLAAAMAGHDYDARGLPYETLYARREVFLLSRIAMKIHRHPMDRDVLTITTWENGVKGAHMQRVYEMTDQTGGLCVSARSDWILVDPETRRILRPSAFTAKPIGVCPKAIDCPDCKKIHLPQGTAEPLGERKTVWSDLDGNGHVHSGRYGDIVWDYLPSDLQDQELRELYLNYSKEAFLGETLAIAGSREGPVYRMEGLGPEGLCFTCECVF